MKHTEASHVRHRARRSTLGLFGLASLIAVSIAQSSAHAAPWGYEQVTPPVKGGGVVQSSDTFQARDDGNAILWSASGSFAGAPSESAPLYVRYLATRSSTGWLNRAIDPPFTPISAGFSVIMEVVGNSANLEYAVVASRVALTPGATDGGGNLYLRNTSTGAYALIATSADKSLTRQFTSPQGALYVRYVSNDGNDVVFTSLVPLVPGAPDGSEGHGEGGVAAYHWTRGAGVAAVSLLPDNEGGGFADYAEALGHSSELGARSALPSNDGARRIFFTTARIGAGQELGPIYLRSGGATRLISASRVAGDDLAGQPARLIATTSGGRFALFTSATRLTEDTPADLPGVAKYVYRYATDSDQLTYIGPLGGSGIDESVLQMSDDGQSIVFISPLDLGVGGVEGQENVYFWRSGTLHLIATADFDNLIGFGGQNSLRLLSPNGRYFMFTDNSPSIAARFGFDNQGRCSPDGGNASVPCGQVYLYDFEGNDGDGALACASCRSDGAAPRGNAGDPSNPAAGVIRMNARQIRTVTDDGAVFFASPDALVPDDSNGLADVYRYRAGRLDLVSRASQGASARLLDITPDGSGVFFSTNDPIVKSDTDHSVDIYLARVGAGFAEVETRTNPSCSGADCRTGTAADGPAGRPASADSALPSANALTPAAHRASVRIRSVRRAGERLRVEIVASTAGAIRVSGSRIRTAQREVRRTGTALLTARLTASSLRKLRQTGRLAVRVRASLSPAFGRPGVISKRLTVRK